MSAKKGAPKPKRAAFAYTSYLVSAGRFAVALCECNVKGYRPVSEYGPYDYESRADGIASRLNERIGVSEATARRIVNSTFGVPS